MLDLKGLKVFKDRLELKDLKGLKELKDLPESLDRLDLRGRPELMV